MSSRNARKELPPEIGAGVAIVLFVSLAYALLARQIFLWLFSVATIGISVYLLYLFYRLVIAVEEIARKL
ncbi:hypothetical protein CV102_11815 [Natronococcus pandeyae]|uniref:Uncharacterized protein n=1 Tax=Natronococcus pandeyae TaxID=2055836 RepID=A0A8J8TQ50_9EURY|nr:hypothetical protein [Natronococcus pandeyae]TYL38481.1 hypothetical protein CV102_11815 [Natronococcus pandeyae]